MAWIFLLKTCKYSDAVYYSYRDKEFYLREMSFIGAPCGLFLTLRGSRSDFYYLKTITEISDWFYRPNAVLMPDQLCLLTEQNNMDDIN